MNKAARLKVLANYAKLGLAEDKNLYRRLRDWLKYQRILQSILVNQSFGSLYLGDAPHREQDGKCRFFITAHFGFYPIILSYLAELYPARRIVCLVGKQQSLDRLVLLAERLRINLEFLEVGDSFISLRRCLRHAKSGSVFLSLIDVPLGVSGKTDTHLPFFSGTIRVRTGLLKLVEKLKLTPRFILAFGSGDRVSLTRYRGDSVEKILQYFTQHIEREPHLWDKVVDLHKFYRSDVNRGIYLPFRIKADYFAMELIDDRVMRISQPLYDQVRRLGQPGRLKEEFYGERQRIYEQTNLFIRKAV